MREIAPDLILTQDLCQVCAPSGNEVSQLLKVLPTQPQILWLTPKSLEQIFDNLRELGEATGRLADGGNIDRGRPGPAREGSRRRHARRRRGREFFCMEWMDPVYCCGHWVPEMVRIAGGIDQLGREGSDSVRIAWEDVLQWKPEILIVMPCGFGLEKAADQARMLAATPAGPTCRRCATAASMRWTRTPISRVPDRGSSRERSCWPICSIPICSNGKGQPTRFGSWARGCGGR